MDEEVVFRRGYEVRIAELGESVQVKPKPFVETGPGDDKFRPLEEPYINFEIVDMDDVPVLDKPFILKVFYDKYHTDAVRNGKTLLLGYWQKDRWNVFPGLNLVEEPKNSGTGYGEVKIDHWEDPMVGWGD